MARGRGARRRALAAAAFLVLAGAPPAAGALDAHPPGFEAGLEAAGRAAFEGSLEEAIAALRPLAGAADAPAEARARASFLLGTLLLRAGRPGAAGPPLEAAAALPGPLADHALARLAQARRAAGEPARAERALARLLTAYPSSPLAEGALREALAGARGGARAEAQLLLADVLVRAGRPAEAAPLLRDLYLALPAAREADRALEMLRALPGGPPRFTEDERFERAMRLYRAGASARSARELAPFAGVAGPRGAQARLAMGIALFQAREYREAIHALEPLLAEPGAAGRAEVLFWLARCHGRLGDRGRFLALLEELVDAAPQHPRAEEALFFLALGYNRDGRPDRAAEAFERFLLQYQTGDRHEAARWGRAWLKYRAGEHGRAAAAFHQLAARAPGWRAQATYWQARALEAAGRAPEAGRLYREVARGHEPYYARLARARLGIAGPAGPPGRGGGDGAPAPGAGHARLAAARALAALWLPDEATEEYWRLVREHPEDRGLVNEAAATFLRLDRADRALALARRILWPQYVQAGGTPPIPAFWDALYPRRFGGLVLEQAAARRLDPFLVLAIIREESTFVPDAVSPAGARGLMQVMPATASRLAAAHGLPAPGRGPTLEEPWYNVALGTAELADLMGEFRGELPLVLAAYNAGAHAVRRWVKERGYTSPEEFVEEIPFDETRTYVKRVLGSYDRYRALYAPSRVPGHESRVEEGMGAEGGGQP